MLKNAVQSVLSQGDVVKVHILDNASTDGTQTWLQELQRSEGSRVELTLRKKNIGALANFSEGFSSVTSQYCVPLADDDELLPDFLQKALEIAERNPGIGGVVFQTERNHPDGRIDISPDFEFEGIVHPDKHIEIWCRSGHYVSWSSILWKSEITSSFEFISNLQKFTYFGDAWLQFLAISKHSFYLYKQVGSVFNFHESQISQNICIELICDYTNIINLISSAIDTNDDLNDTQKNALKTNLLKNWNGMVEQQCPKIVEKLSINQKSQYIDRYLMNLHSEAKLSLFPFLSFFDNHNILFDSLKKFEAEVAWLRSNWIPKSDLDLVHNSKSWKITAPLRVIENIFRKLFENR
jgi:glycosyltransferase involved in cell wall biosynthesis